MCTSRSSHQSERLERVELVEILLLAPARLVLVVFHQLFERARLRTPVADGRFGPRREQLSPFGPSDLSQGAETFQDEVRGGRALRCVESCAVHQPEGLVEPIDTTDSVKK